MNIPLKYVTLLTQKGIDALRWSGVRLLRKSVSLPLCGGDFDFVKNLLISDFKTPVLCDMMVAAQSLYVDLLGRYHLGDLRL